MKAPIDSVQSSDTAFLGGAFEMRRRTSSTLRQPPAPTRQQPLYYNDDFHTEHNVPTSSDTRSRMMDVPPIHPSLSSRGRKTEPQSSLPSSPRSGRGEPRIYCDLDGVLVDFCQGISEAFEVQLDSHNIDALPRHELWQKVQQRHAFFEHLSWCDGGKELWDAIAPLRPSILTGVPSYCHRAPRDQKFAWCVRELSAESLVSFQLVDKAGPLRQHLPVRRHIKPVLQPPPPTTYSAAATAVVPGQRPTARWSCHVITCWSERKHHECRPGDILIDDRLDLRRSWEAAGGVFVHHRTGDTENTLEQLRRLDILPANEEHPVRP
jgi:hypothetical protein